jgi:hypothetical protein
LAPVPDNSKRSWSDCHCASTAARKALPLAARVRERGREGARERGREGERERERE